MRSEAYWIDGPWPGRLAIVPRPRGADWLPDEVAAWRRAGLDVVVSALTPAEIADFGLLEEARLVEGAGLMYLSFPMPDRGIPEDHRQALSLLHRLEELLAAGKNVGVHCRQGIGRSALLAGGLLVLGGVKPEAAIERVNQSRGVPVPETPEQRRWIASVANELVHKP